VEPFYLVTIEGDPGRAAGLLALNGIQNLDYRESSVTARLRAADPESAGARVRAALANEPLTIGPVRHELPPLRMP
jgi:hypothetical protein